MRGGEGAVDDNGEIGLFETEYQLPGATRATPLPYLVQYHQQS